MTPSILIPLLADWRLAVSINSHVLDMWCKLFQIASNKDGCASANSSGFFGTVVSALSYNWHQSLVKWSSSSGVGMLGDRR